MRRWLRTYLKELLADPPAPAPTRPQYPCGVASCFLEQRTVEQNAADTTVECAEHGCWTTWPTTPSAVAPLNVIRVQDAWRQHGTNGPPR